MNRLLVAPNLSWDIASNFEIAKGVLQDPQGIANGQMGFLSGLSPAGPCGRQTEAAGRGTWEATVSSGI